MYIAKLFSKSVVLISTPTSNERDESTCLTTPLATLPVIIFSDLGWFGRQTFASCFNVHSFDNWWERIAFRVFVNSSFLSSNHPFPSSLSRLESSELFSWSYTGSPRTELSIHCITLITACDDTSPIPSPALGRLRVASPNYCMLLKAQLRLHFLSIAHPASPDLYFSFPFHLI